jgi:hypothetical protein
MLWFKKGADEGGQVVSEILASAIHKIYTDVADVLHTLGYMTEEERIELSNVIGTTLSQFRGQLKSKVPSMLDKNVKSEDLNKINEKL